MRNPIHTQTIIQDEQYKNMSNKNKKNIIGQAAWVIKVSINFYTKYYLYKEKQHVLHCRYILLPYAYVLERLYLTSMASFKNKHNLLVCSKFSGLIVLHIISISL